MEMSALQLGLLAMGGGVLACVAAYNWWTAQRSVPRRRFLRRREAPAGPLPTPPDVEQGDEALRREPVLDAGLLVFADTTGEGIAAEAVRVAAATLDPLIDAVAHITLEHVVSGDAVLAAMPTTRRVGTKPFAVEGLNQQTESWEPPRAGQRYKTLQAGVQLANRNGALNEIEFSEFVVKVEHFADTLSGTPDFPDMMQEVARARELDQFAGAHDALLGFSVLATRAVWSPGYLTQHAARHGFVSGALPGRMVLPASEPGAAPVLVLQFETQAALAEDPERSALHEFHLTLDVPHVARSERPYVRMREAAQALAQTMEGMVVDGSGRALSPEAMDSIGADLEKLYDALQERDLAAGSALARRLFS